MKSFACTFVITALIWLPTPISAQIGWLNPEGKPGIQFEYTSASFDERSYLSFWGFPTGSLFFTARANLAPNVDWVIEVPAVYSKIRGTYWFNGEIYGPTSTDIAIANPYIGFEWEQPGSSRVASLGARIPIISRDNFWSAIPHQYISSSRFMSYLHKVIQLSAAGGYRYVNNSGFGFRVTAGGQLGIPNQGDPEVFGDFNTCFWYQGNSLRVGAGLSTLAQVTESDIDFGDRLLTTVNFFGDLKAGQWSPGAHLQIPVGDNLSRGVDLIYGLHLSYFFRVTEK